MDAIGIWRRELFIRLLKQLHVNWLNIIPWLSSTFFIRLHWACRYWCWDQTSIWLHSKQQQHASQHLVIFLILEKNICCFRFLILQAFSISLAALLSYSCSVLNKFKFCCPLYFCPMLHCMDPFVFLHSCYCVHSNQKSWHLVDAAAIVFPCYTISIVS